MDVLDTTNSGNRTLAAVLYETSQPLRLTALGIPELKPGQVLVDIAYSGVCHSQLNEAFGRKGPDPYLPHALGHEGSGTVVAAGSAVTKVQAGDAVVLTWIKGTGADVPGSVYASADGPVNSGAISTFMRRAVVSENRLVPLPEGMPMREAALLGCAIPTGAGIVLNTGEVGAGASVAVFGAGGIGIGAVMAAVAVGAETVIAVDVNAARLADAHAAGATHTVDAGSEDAAAAVVALTGGRGVDLAIEAAGRPQAMEAAFQATRGGGGLCVLAGNLAHGGRISIDPFQLIAGRRLVGSWGGGTQPDRDIPRYAAMFLDGRLDLGRLIGREYRLEEINSALDDLEHGRVLRPLIGM